MFLSVTWGFVFDNVLFVCASVCEQETLAKSSDHASLPYVGSQACSASVQAGEPC